ncbi:MAG: amidohydrolase family protein, partial [Myxococcales bacterium]|nr:amidohydrolase family protein [Myxococcales bacterium]
VAVDYPDVKFVMCHLGNPWFQDTAEVLYKNRNVYADISGLTLGESISYKFERYVAMRVKEMVTYMGDPGRQILYGTDWPLVAMRPYLKLLGELEFTPAQLETICWGTASALFKIPEEALARAAATRAPTASAISCSETKRRRARSRRALSVLLSSRTSSRSTSPAFCRQRARSSVRSSSSQAVPASDQRSAFSRRSAASASRSRSSAFRTPFRWASSRIASPIRPSTSTRRGWSSGNQRSASRYAERRSSSSVARAAAKSKALAASSGASAST